MIGDMANKQRPAFGYYGGKYSHLDWLLPLLPERERYVEPFAGSAAVLLNRPEATTETLNDIDGNIANFFRVVRDNPEALAERLWWTPYARDEYHDGIAVLNEPDEYDDVERAVAFFAVMGQVVGGVKPTPGAWSYAVTSSPQTQVFYNRIERVGEISQRLRRVQIESLDAVDIMERYDSDETLFYCDPPYPFSSRGREGVEGNDRGYSNESPDDWHEQFLKKALELDGDVAISSYPNEMYAHYLDEWYLTEVDTKASVPNTHVEQSGKRTEVLYTNYDPDSVIPPSKSGDVLEDDW